MDQRIRVIGGGLAGCEAAWQIARRGVPVELWEMRPVRGTEAHVTDRLAELVCSNSFRSDDAERNAVGLLHEEMRRADSLVMAAADRHKVPAGQALAVDRTGFADAVQQAIEEEPAILLHRAEMPGLTDAADGLAIVATGPLTAPALSQAILDATGEEHLAFFDALAPIVHHDSIDFETAWFQSRYDKAGPGGDRAAYINCPLDGERYEAFIDALLAADTIPFRDWERDTPYFQGCLPIEVMAARGRDTLRFGPMKPVGLTDPATGARPHAVVQLRQDNALGTLFNMVGFQTKLTHGAQKRVLPPDPRAGAGALREARRHPPQHLHQQPGAAGFRASASPRAARALRRPDHRRRGLRRERGHRPAGRALRCGGAGWRRGRAPAADDGAGLAAHPHHRRAPRCGRHLPADERQLRPVSAPCRTPPQERTQGRDGRARTHRPRPLAG